MPPKQPDKENLAYIPIGKEFIVEKEIAKRPSQRFSRLSRDTIDRKTITFADTMRRLLYKLDENQPLDVMYLNLEYWQPYCVEHVEEDVFRHVLERGDLTLQHTYMKALDGVMLVRKPGEAYPRQLQVLKGKLKLSDRLVGGVEFKGGPPKPPGFFSKLLYQLFDITTESMAAYLQHRHLYDSVAVINAGIEKRAEELRKNGTLKIERMKPGEDRETALYWHKANTGPYKREILHNRQWRTYLQTFLENTNSLPKLVAPQPEGQQYDPEIRGMVGMLLSTTEMVNGEAVEHEGFSALEQQMQKGRIKTAPEDLDLEYYVNSLGRFDAAAQSGDLNEMGSLISEALANGRRLLCGEIGNEKGASHRLVHLVTACNQMLDHLEKPENGNLKDAVYRQGLSEKDVEMFRGMQELVVAFREGLRQHSALLAAASQTEPWTSSKEQYECMKIVLLGNQAEAILCGAKDPKVYEHIGFNAMHGRSFASEYEKPFENSKQIEKYSNYNVRDLAVVFTSRRTISQVNERVLGEALGVPPKKMHIPKEEVSQAKEQEKAPKKEGEQAGKAGAEDQKIQVPQMG